ncbi:hypothetical protein M409DRAFT_35986 [Zasmidium cellare ATCC 36951]|uniref:Uncharacterized protein n=1 Tax=Zasmidium cellare ATCC 36951 TaxID=1080233 RepID=A0A6A6CX87_ZASCE|nr:uncharacterized protein M409DRAFT_35986 [Zasmidium cellare ATCC 36951]KAF2169976.1 hypothetical protein M409DRAFT_35986 [Zasmidium cellare ATCC 36951]
MGTTKVVYVFGDQALDTSADLSRILSIRQGPVTQAFIEHALQTLRFAVNALPHSNRVKIERFADVQDLITQKRNGTLHPALEQALACFYHLVSFISHLEREQKNYPTHYDAILVGLCTGTIAAAAISACRTLTELLPVAVHAVKVAFYTGSCAVNFGDILYPPRTNESLAHWSLLLPNLTSSEASSMLQEFARNGGFPQTSTPWISATAEHSVTISGPPDKLGAFHRSDSFAGRSSALLPIFAPYHAPPIFDERSVESVLEESGTNVLPGRDSLVPVIATYDRDSSWGDTLLSTMRVAVASILRYPLHWERIMESVGAQLSLSAHERVEIVGIGTKQAQALRSHILKLGVVQDVDIERLTVPLESSETNSGPKQEKIAIIGMSGRYPEADDCDEFWSILSQGLDVHKPVPDLHWSKEHVDVTGNKKNTSATPFGCWLKSPGMFDAKFFHMSPREAPQVDPLMAQRLALLTAYEAMEDAGVTPESSASTQKDRVGVFYGVTSNDWMETNSAQNIDTYFIPGGNRAFIPGRVNYFFKFSGPSYSVDTACSSSLAAIHLACNALWRREIDTAIAGGTNVLTNPDFTSGLDRGHFLSRTGNCRTFDDSADGYCRGEGVVTFIMKRLEDALADNDPIRAVILGAYTNHSAEADSITRPHVGAQRQIFQKILHDSGVEPGDVSYVEMHGTGTQAGDASEMLSVLDTFAPSKPKRRRSKDQSLYIGSAKANIGHGEAASGASSLSKVLLMMKHNTIPPHCGIKTRLNRKFPKDLSDRQAFIADKATPWMRETGTSRRAFVNNFSAAGGNTALLIEDAPLRTQDHPDPRTLFPVCISAKTASAMAKNLKAFERYLNETSTESDFLQDASYTTTARRVHHPHRALIMAADTASLKKGFAIAIDQKIGSHRTKAAPKIIFAFTGQGSQYVGMGKKLYDTFSSFRRDLEQFDHIAQSHGFPSFLSVIAEDGKDLTAVSPTKTQLALTCLQVALARLWVSWNIQPSLVVGHSLGEYAALCIAGVLSISDTIYLVGSRAQLLETRCTKYSHAMLAVRASDTELKDIVDNDKIEVACINGPLDRVLSGHSSSVKAIQTTLQKAGIKSTLLKVPFAFHSAQVDPILDDFEKIARSVRLKEPNITVLSPLKGGPESTFDAKYLRDHCRYTVDFSGAIEGAHQNGLLQKGQPVLEIGPQPVVSGMFKTILGDEISTLPCLAQNQDSWKLMATALKTLYESGHNVNWVEYNRDFQHRVVELPHYQWDLQHYWIDYVHDWSLRKGDPWPAAYGSASTLSTTVHKASPYADFKETGRMIVESDISRSDLSQVVRGHEVDGFPLCTPSVYGDIALSIGRFLAQVSSISLDKQVTVVADMNITAALIAKPKGPQILRTTAVWDATTSVASCKFESISDTGKVTSEHATCNIRFTEKAQLQDDAAETKSKINALRKRLLDDKAYQFNRSMIYKCIGALANFDPNYRGLFTITMDSNDLEASNVVEFSSVSAKGDFHTHPAYIDALSQVGGFVMNCNDQTDLSKEVFVNHGWGSFHMVEPLSATEKYQAHVKMRETPNKLWKGDIVVLRGDKVAAKFCDIALQAVPRRLLKYVLSRGGGESAVAAALPEPVAAKPVSKELEMEKAVPHLPNGSLAHHDAPKPTVSHTQVKQPSAKASSNLAVKLLDIISEESGISADELTDDLALQELGVDSLLSLLIISRINDELEIDLDQAKFAEMSTVGQIKSYVASCTGRDIEPSLVQHETLEGSQQMNSTDAAPLDLESGDFPLLQTTGSASDSSAEGHDSGKSLDSGPASPPDTDSTGATTPLADLEILKDSTTNSKPSQERAAPPASSVIIQGKTRSAGKILFLLPDGSGSAHSYIDIPNVHPDLAIIGLNSPFRGDAASMKHSSLESIVQSYTAEIRRRQPNGPYHVGGWSAGGILAYCVAKALIGEEEEEVANLFLIDSPEPTGLDHLPQRFYDHCHATGVFGKKVPGSSGTASPPEWLMPHFEATIDLLHDYKASPLLKGQAPKTSLIWAADCVFDGVDFPYMPDAAAEDQDDGEAVKFLTEKRTDFSAGYWGRLFPGGQVSVEVAKGAHHFSLMVCFDFVVGVSLQLTYLSSTKTHTSWPTLSTLLCLSKRFERVSKGCCQLEGKDVFP